METFHPSCAKKKEKRLLLPSSLPTKGGKSEKAPTPGERTIHANGLERPSFHGAFFKRLLYVLPTELKKERGETIPRRKGGTPQREKGARATFFSSRSEKKIFSVPFFTLEDD